MDMNKKEYKLVIFDVDGTLLDTSEGLLKSAIYTIGQLGYEMPVQDVLFSFIGPRIQDSFERVYGLCGKKLDEAAAVFRKRYKEGDVLLARPYEGVYDILRWMKNKGMHIAVATNKRQDFVDALMEKYEFAVYMEAVYGTDMEGKLKKADLIQKCICSFSDCGADQTVMIGDSSYDAIAAQEAGVDFIGVTYGFEFRNSVDVDQWENVGCAGTVHEILKCLTRLIK